MKASWNFKIGGATVAPSIDAILNSIFDHRSVAKDAKTFNGIAASHGDEVDSIPDQINGHTLNYSGYKQPNATGKQPIYYKQSGVLDGQDLGIVFMENEAGIQFDSRERTGLNDYNSWGFVFTAPDYYIFEAWGNHITRYYFGNTAGKSSTFNNNSIPIRTTPDGNTIDAPIIPNAINCFILQGVNDGLASSNDRVSLKIWLNGTLLNPNTHMESYKRPTKTEGFGTDSNMQMTGIIENFHSYQNLTSTQIDEAFTALNSYYKLGQTMPLPYATNVVGHLSGSTVYVTYDYFNPLGVAEDKSSTVIDWWWTASGIQGGKFEPSVKNLKSFNRTTTSGKFLDGQGIRVNVRPKDVNGAKNWGCPGVWFGSF